MMIFADEGVGVFGALIFCGRYAWNLARGGLWVRKLTRARIICGSFRTAILFIYWSIFLFTILTYDGLKLSKISNRAHLLEFDGIWVIIVGLTLSTSLFCG